MLLRVVPALALDRLAGERIGRVPHHTRADATQKAPRMAELMAQCHESRVEHRLAAGIGTEPVECRQMSVRRFDRHVGSGAGVSNAWSSLLMQAVGSRRCRRGHTPADIDAAVGIDLRRVELTNQASPVRALQQLGKAR